MFIKLTTRYLSRWMDDSDFRSGCPVTTISLETTPESEPLSQACSDAFGSWINAVANIFIECGLSKSAAQRLSLVFISSFEGAFILARAQRNTKPFDVVGDACLELLP